MSGVTCVYCRAVYSGHYHSRICRPCNAAREPAKNAAQRAVVKAIEQGVIPKIETQYCVDCGRFAEVYDHRDYARPLHVEPVCRKCNFRRGPARWSREEAAAA